MPPAAASSAAPLASAPSTSRDPAGFGLAASAAALAWSLRPHQWLKNALVFLPVLTSHTYGDPGVLKAAAGLFLAWCLVASAGYLWNDLRDLESDRCIDPCFRRPLAAGRLRPWVAWSAMVPLAGAGLAVAHGIEARAAVVLAAYALLSAFYSWRLKRVRGLDVALLTAFYLLRTVSGGEATGNPVSPWLLAFSGCFFTGLALLKRTAQLRFCPITLAEAGNRPHYLSADGPVLRASGIGAGALAALVLSGYCDRSTAAGLYALPAALWVLPVLLLLWQGRMWRAADEGKMTPDPLWFAVRDPVSWGVGAAAAATVFVAVTGIA